ncbi:MAG: class I SAM-dependent methyltransferase [Candidatus Sericytochromatia bacterium]|nr:class I SAM-dependent methyltransferase [Candidatus Sericytochromatia bacterium]
MSKFDTGVDKELRRLIRQMERTCSEMMERERRAPGTVLESRACPACGEERSSGQLAGSLFPYVRCATCTLLYMSPALPATTVEAGFSHEDTWTREYWSLMKARIRLDDIPGPVQARQHPVLREVLSHRSGGRLLDVGCSFGQFMAHARHFFEVEGLEINPETAAMARARGLVVHEGRIEDREGKDVYDVITLNQLLYGLHDPLALVRETARLLRPGGLLYINTPHADSLAMRWFAGKHCHVLGKVNLNVFNRRSLMTMAGRAGLEPVAFHTEWLNLYGPDILVHALLPRAFVHRRNTFVPAYSAWCRMDEWLQRRLMGNRFPALGDYAVAVFCKPGRVVVGA